MSFNRRQAAVGGAVGIAWIAGLLAAEPLVGEFALIVVAEGIIVRSPGWLSTLAISQLGFYAQPVLLLSIAAAVVAIAASVAAVWPDDSERLAPLALVLGGVGTALLLIAAGSGLSVGFVAGLVVTLVPPAVVARLLTARPEPAGRRGFLRRVGGVALLGGASLAGIRAIFDRLMPRPASPRADAPLDREISPPTGDPAFDFAGMPDAVTDPDDHYVVDISVSSPRIDLDSWTLDIEGAVADPYSLAYDALLDHDDSVEQTTTMLCISNQVGGDLIGTAHWTGVPLSALIEAADPDAEAVDVVTHAADGYSEAIPLERIEREDILLAYGMGDRTLSTDHGFPVRLLIPGRYGMKMTKWITRIELSESSHEAYWEGRGWDEEAIVNTMAYVRGAERSGDRVTVGGVVFGGLISGVEELAGVEVSVDGGQTWDNGELEPQLDPHAWRRWRYEFEAPDNSAFDVVVRAIERGGTIQTETETSPRPSGATGWHRQTVTVS